MRNVVSGATPFVATGKLPLCALTEEYEGEGFEHNAEDEIHGDPDNSESRVHWQASGFVEAPPPYETPTASRETSVIPSGKRRQRLSQVKEDAEFRTPYTPNAFNDRYSNRSARGTDGFQQRTPVGGCRAASGSRENTPSRPPSVTPMRGSRGALGSQRAIPNQPPSSGSQRGTPNQPSSGSRRSAPSQPPSGYQRGTSGSQT